MQDESLNQNEQDLERALGGLRPAAPRISHEQIIFEAGKQAARRGLAVWRGLASVLGVALAVAVLWRPTPTTVERTVERIVYREAPPADPGPVRLAMVEPQIEAVGSTYVAMRNQVLQHGLDALPQASAAPVRHMPIEQVLGLTAQELKGMPALRERAAHAIGGGL